MLMEGGHTPLSPGYRSDLQKPRQFFLSASLWLPGQKAPPQPGKVMLECTLKTAPLFPRAAWDKDHGWVSELSQNSTNKGFLQHYSFMGLPLTNKVQEVSMVSLFLTGLNSIARGKKCALEDVKAENIVRNENKVLRSQSTLWNLELLPGQGEWVRLSKLVKINTLSQQIEV